MRVGLGLAFENKIKTNEESTTLAALSRAVVDALLSAAGLFHLRNSFRDLQDAVFFKELELRLHYDGFDIQNIDITVVSGNKLPELVLQSFKEKICHTMFLDENQVNIKSYLVENNTMTLQVQAVALVG